MRKQWIFYVLSLLPAHAFALDADDARALQETQLLLASPGALNAYAGTHRDAAQALAQVNQATAGNPAQNAELSAISSSVFGDLVRQTGGDSAAVQEKLQLALKDPGAFMKTLTPEQQARIHSLASEIDKGRAPSSK